MRTARSLFHSLTAALAIASLAACGGGGGGAGGSGGAGGGGPASTPRITLTQSAVDISRPVTLGSGPEERIGITLENVQLGNYIRVRATGNGLRHIQDVRNGSGIDVLLEFKAPFEL